MKYAGKICTKKRQEVKAIFVYFEYDKATLTNYGETISCFHQITFRYILNSDNTVIRTWLSSGMLRRIVP
jgi:hypothetical protein